VLKSLSDRYSVIGIDTSPLAVEYCHRRGLDGVIQASAEDLLDRSANVDAVLLLDVIEHIDDDVGVLRTVSQLVRPGGRVLITVPAHPWMWSAHDVVNQHRRRYTRKALRMAIVESGLELTELRYFNSILFPLVVAGKVASRVARSESAHVTPGKRLGIGNAMLARMFAAERHLIPYAALPFGVSLMAVARRPAS
jgi:2-polyprenyl-3-methyl-5-hydroxy-6-metoxy-1,4-benzoquinol methylase